VRAAFLAFAAAEPGRYAVVDARPPEAEVLQAALRTLARVAGRAPCLQRFARPSAADEPRRPPVRMTG